MIKKSKNNNNINNYKNNNMVSSSQVTVKAININTFKGIIVFVAVLALIDAHDLSLYTKTASSLLSSSLSSMTSLPSLIYTAKAKKYCTGIADNKVYYSDVCADGDYISQSDSIHRCEKLWGKGWQLASIYTSNLNDRANEAAISGKSSWLGGDCAERYGVWRWQYGPAAGLHFFSGFGDNGYKINNRYNDWKVEDYIIIKKRYPKNNGNPYVYRKKSGGHWENDPKGESNGVICEKVYYKCFEKGTSSGNYVDPKKITCTCKDGYSGSLCDTIAVVDGEYHYTYTAFCGIERSWDETKRFISYKKVTWAQPNSAVQLEAVKKLTDGNAAWLPAWYNDGANQWRWTDGPLKNEEVKLGKLLPSGSKDALMSIHENGGLFGEKDDYEKKCVVWQTSQYVPTTTTAITTTSPLTTTFVNTTMSSTTASETNYTITNMTNATATTSSNASKITNTNSSQTITTTSTDITTTNDTISTTTINISTTTNGNNGSQSDAPLLSSACEEISNAVRMAAAIMSCIVTILAILIGIPSIVAQVQGVVAVGMLSSSQEFSAEAFGSSYRALSPFALSESYIGVAGGNMVVIGIIAIVQLIVLFAIKRLNTSTGWINSMAKVRFPSILLSCVFALYCGTSFAASQMVSLPNRPLVDRVVGAVILVLFILLPIGLVLFTHFFTNRAYFEFDVYTWLRQKNLPPFLKSFVYTGAIFGADTREAYGPLIRYRLKHSFWASYLTWSPLVVSIAGVFQPHGRGGRAALLIVFGLASIGIGAFIAIMRPHRVQIVSFVEAAAHVLLGVAFIIAGIGNAAAACVSIPIATFGFFIIILFFVRIIHAITAYFIGREVLTVDSIQKTLLWTTFNDKDHQIFELDIDNIISKHYDDNNDKNGVIYNVNTIHNDLASGLIIDSSEKSYSRRSSDVHSVFSGTSV